MKSCSILKRRCRAFSLVEMLMALLVASLLMVALAPVMTKKFNETISIGGGNQFVHEVAYGSSFCPVGAEPKKYDDGTEYCEGEFTVPMGVNKIEVTLVGGGGGGAAAATAGIWEKTTAGTEEFKIPQLVNQLEVTLVAGGSGGGAGGQTLKNVTFTATGKGGVATEDENNIVKSDSSGEISWDVPETTQNKYALLTACGGGGGAGGGGDYNGGGGGAGGYYFKKAVSLGDNKTLTVRIGGGGSGGGADNGEAVNGRAWGGGGGGGGCYTLDCIATSPSQTVVVDGETIYYGAGGYEYNDSRQYGGKGAIGGGKDGGSFSGTNTHDILYGGDGFGGGGKGGNGRNWSGSDGAGGGGGSAIAGGGGGGGPFGGGGGGGGPTWIKEIGNDTVASGGGGGGGGGYKYYGQPYGAGGGGGGGTEGGAGGNGTQTSGDKEWIFPGDGGGPNKFPGIDLVGGISGYLLDGEKQETIFGSGYCNGGNTDWQGKSGKSGKDGAMRISYLDYGPGGGGGGNGTITPVQSLKVAANDKISVRVGVAAGGGSAGAIESSGNVRAGSAGGGSQTIGYSITSQLSQNGSVVLSTCFPGDWNNYYACMNWGGSSTGSNHGPSGAHHSSGTGMNNGSPTQAGYGNVAVAGFSGEWGGYGMTPEGKRGAQSVLFGLTDHCTPGKGGKDISKTAEITSMTDEEAKEAKIKEAMKGEDAMGYGGCGGGGGYSLHNGGKGTPGYARISWNKTYKRGSEDEYEYINGGGGGGGSAGNVFRYSIKVQGGDVLKYKIGKGGTGGGWTLVEKTINGVKQKVLEQVQPTKGGMTELTTANNEILRAGGGLGGAFPLLNTITVDTYSSSATYNKDNLTAGLGAEAPTLCEFINSSGETESFVDKEKLCSKKAGEDGSATGGGKGADAGFGAGTGGAAGATGGKVAANGSPAVGFGAGGGGAGLADLGTVNATDAVTNPTVGGNGGDGKIIFRWK